MQTSAQVLTESGHHRDNRRGLVNVTTTATDMAEIQINLAPGLGQTAQTITIVLAGDHLTHLWKALRSADSTARHLTAVPPVEGVA